MKVYVTQGWVDEDGPHAPGDELTFPDFEGDPTEHGIEGHKYAYLVNNGWVSHDAPAIATTHDADAPAEKKSHRARSAKKR
jgi:hypothetical protein